MPLRSNLVLAPQTTDRISAGSDCAFDCGKVFWMTYFVWALTVPSEMASSFEKCQAQSTDRLRFECFETLDLEKLSAKCGLAVSQY